MYDLPETFCVYCGRTIRQGRWRRRSSLGLGHICRRCWPKSEEKRRIPPPHNPIVKLADGARVTLMVRKRLEQDARRVVKLGLCDYVARLLLPAIAIYLFLFHLGPSRSFIEVLPWICVLAACAISALLLSIPRFRRVQAKLIELATDRKKRIDEAQAFYSSPEWSKLRDNVITKRGTRCAQCGREIRRKTDVTVDHILPRSKHPQLALEETNLQVLCRSCNSAKGDSILEELREVFVQQE
jgi:5-methylcytosine-specific restriction endonuclease McrA